MKTTKIGLAAVVLLCLMLSLATSALAAGGQGTTTDNGNNAYSVTVSSGTDFTFATGEISSVWDTAQIQLPFTASSLTLAANAGATPAFTMDLSAFTLLTTINVGTNCTLTLDIPASKSVTINNLAITAGAGGGKISFSGDSALSISAGSVTLPDSRQSFTADFGTPTDYKIDDNNTSGFMALPAVAANASAVSVTLTSGNWTPETTTAKFGVSGGKVFTITKNASNNYTVSVVTSGTITATPPQISQISASRTSEADASVTFTSSKAGICYYVVQETNLAPPTIDTNTPSYISCNAGVTNMQLSLSGISAKKLYFVVIDNTGNVSAMNSVEITALQTATVYVNLDGSGNSGKSYKLVNGSVEYPLSSSITGVYTANVPNGTWTVYEGNTSTGISLSINGGSGGATLNYYTVNFTASPTGTTSSAWINATYGGAPIISGAQVLSGKALSLTAYGSGADSYTYAWSGTGTSGQTAQTLTINSLSGTVNANCKVTGKTTPVITINTQPQGKTVTYPNSVALSVSASVSPGTSLSYQWQRSSSSGGNYSNIGSATGSSYNVSQAAGTTYYYRCVVSATGAANATSNPVAVTVYKADFSSAPVITSVYATGSSGSVYVAWNASTPSASSYTVTAYTSNGSTAKTVTGITGRNTTVTGLSNGTSYYFKVTAVLDSYNDKVSSSSSSAAPSGGSSTISIRSGTSSSTDIIGTTYSLGSAAAASYTATSYAKTLNIYNTGSSQLTGVTASVTGSNFTITSSPTAKISSGGSGSFTIRPVSGLSKGTYTATVTVAADNANAQKFTVSFTVGSSGALIVSTSSKSSDSAISKYAFDSAVVGYAARDAVTFYVHNNSNVKLTGVTAALSGSDRNSFTLSKLSSSTISTSGSQTFTVKPDAGLKAGTYTATVTISSDQAEDYKINLTFVVNSGYDMYATDRINGTAVSACSFDNAAVGYSAVEPVTLYIYNNAGSQMTGVKAALSGDNSKNFTLSKTNIGAISRNEYETFTVKPDTGLKAGTYTATVTVSSNQTDDYTVKLTFVVKSSYEIYLAEKASGGYITAYTFKGATVAYAAQDPATFYVINNLKSKQTGVTVTLSGDNKNSFTLTKNFSVIAAGDYETITIKPNTGLAAGTYKAKVIVSSDQADDFTLNLTFVVKAGAEMYITDRKSGTAASTYYFDTVTEGYPAPAYQTFYVYNDSGGELSGVKLSLIGSGQNVFTLGYSALGTIANGGYETFTLAPRAGLAAGTYTATLTASADNGATAAITVSVTVKAAETVSPFYDVPVGAWYYNDVKRANELGLIDGVTTTLYKPDDNLTIAQAIKLACCVHQRYNYGSVSLTNGYPNWYDSYVQYALNNGIISGGYEDYRAIITREEFVNIMYNSLPSSDYVVLKNLTDNYIPDVAPGNTYYNKIFRFYQAGILTGSDSAGTFNPKSNIKRSEVAAILTRIYDKEERIG